MRFKKGNSFAFKKGKSGNPGGCPKGIKQKSTVVKESILKAFDKDKFALWANRNQTDFYNLMVKVMPRELEIDANVTAERLVLIRPAKEKG